ncbi:hypothetical protein L2E82_13788 [Cichorium intybus]|uniref:Uncharacterized protein n=1 Tax=Cichorium intybus TaxID=13427 RepID=A0ACB9EYK5_CICIN|nr:hypothetical protein L2E82_13788 [Cichorium intybus]
MILISPRTVSSPPWNDFLQPICCDRCNYILTKISKLSNCNMDANANVDAIDTSKKNKPKSVWDHNTFMEFLKLCIIELENGNRPGSHFNKVGWSNIEKKIKEKTGKSFDKKQLKNKWDNMKKDWKLYDRLMRSESGIGWDSVRNTIDAPNEWWDEKIKGDKDLAKFRNTNLYIYQKYYEPLFRDSVAVGDKTRAPSEFQNDSSPNDAQDVEEIVGKAYDDDITLLGDNEPLFPLLSSNKKNKSKHTTTTSSSKGKSSVTSSFDDKLDTVLEALASRSTETFKHSNSSPTTQECIDIVTRFPDFQEGSLMYCKALRIFLKKQARENFMVPTCDVAKMAFLQLLMDE